MAKDTNKNTASDIAPTETPRKPFALYCMEPSLTVQAAKDECDINLIISRATKGYDITHVNERVAKYGDFTDIPTSYQEALNLVNRAEGMFMSMSPEVREKFNNDPGKMVEFIKDPKNRVEAEKLGLVVVTEIPAPKPAEGGTPEATDPKGSEKPPAAK